MTDACTKEYFQRRERDTLVVVPKSENKCPDDLKS